MNELQQVLLIFAVVVIAGLYFLSRSRQSKSSENKKSHSQPDSANQTHEVSSIEKPLDPQLFNADAVINPQKKKASEALKELGTPHIPLSSSTEDRLTKIDATDIDSDEVEAHLNNSSLASPSTNSAVQDSGVNSELSEPHIQQATPNVSVESRADVTLSNNVIENEELAKNDSANGNHPNQGQLSFGDEFDFPQDKQPAILEDDIQLKDPPLAEQTESSAEMLQDQTASEKSEVKNVEAPTPPQNQPKHHVLVVDDPGMTGEIQSDRLPPDEIKPNFGIPDEVSEKQGHVYVSTDKKPEVYVLLVMSTGNEFAMADVNQALYGVGLKLSEQSIFVKKDNMGNEFIKVANMLEPGTFPVENLEQFNTPGVAMILELPTTVRAPAAMHDLIMMARKVSQRLNGRLYNMERHLIKESDLQSMRDAALDYESEPLTN